MGADVTVITSSANKRKDAEALGANGTIITSDSQELNACARKLDFILETISADHDLEVFLRLLRTNGTLCIVGVPAKPLGLSVMSLESGRKSIAGSAMGGLPEPQEMLDFCGSHNITANIELIPIQEINVAFERLKRNDVKYRFVIDMESMR
jgi:alcohol dehydrogenase (NADP+)